MIGHWISSLNPSLLWALIALVLGLAELIVPGVFLVFLAIAAAITAGLALVLPMGSAYQMLIFSILSALCVSGGRLFYLARPGETTDPMLNDKAARLIGRPVEVCEPIVHGEGRVRVDDSSWPANGPDAPKGARMTVIEVSGATLIVGFPAA